MKNSHRILVVKSISDSEIKKIKSIFNNEVTIVTRKKHNGKETIILATNYLFEKLKISHDYYFDVNNDCDDKLILALTNFIKCFPYNDNDIYNRLISKFNNCFDVIHVYQNNRTIISYSNILITDFFCNQCNFKNTQNLVFSVKKIWKEEREYKSVKTVKISLYGLCGYTRKVVRSKKIIPKIYTMTLPGEVSSYLTINDSIYLFYKNTKVIMMIWIIIYNLLYYVFFIVQLRYLLSTDMSFAIQIFGFLLWIILPTMITFFKLISSMKREQKGMFKTKYSSLFISVVIRCFLLQTPIWIPFFLFYELRIVLKNIKKNL